jgi:hypothetical protein
MQEEDFLEIRMKECRLCFIAAQLRTVLLLEAFGCTVQHKALLFLCFPGLEF